MFTYIKEQRGEIKQKNAEKTREYKRCSKTVEN